jgi:hypothetical protein
MIHYGLNSIEPLNAVNPFRIKFNSHLNITHTDVRAVTFDTLIFTGMEQ